MKILELDKHKHTAVGKQNMRVIINIQLLAQIYNQCGRIVFRNDGVFVARKMNYNTGFNKT